MPFPLHCTRPDRWACSRSISAASTWPDAWMDAGGGPFVSLKSEFSTAGAESLVMVFLNGVRPRLSAVYFNHR
jgi:hypothetical protein